MIKLVFVLRRRPELSRDEFQTYWREKHAPLVASHGKALGLQRYVQTHTIDSPLNDLLQASRGGPAEYEAKFIDLPNSPLWLAEEHQIV